MNAIGEPDPKAILTRLDIVCVIIINPVVELAWDDLERLRALLHNLVRRTGRAKPE